MKVQPNLVSAVLFANSVTFDMLESWLDRKELLLLIRRHEQLDLQCAISKQIFILMLHNSYRLNCGKAFVESLKAKEIQTGREQRTGRLVRPIAK